jgi:small subunit ribosomal protein S6
MRRYEAVVILHPDMGEDDVRNFTERYTQLVKTSGGEIIKIEDWGLKRLAYLVQKKEKGRYILFDFVGNPALISEMERQFKISEDVMKYLSVKIDHDVDLEAFKTPPKSEAEAPEVQEQAPGAETPPTEPAAETAEASDAEPADAAAAAPTPEAETPVEPQPAEADAEPTAVTPEAAKEGE